MKSSRLILSAALIGVLTHSVQAKLDVVATTPDLGSIVREIGGDLVEIEILARPKEDAHFVSARPSFIVKLNKADVLVDGGAELEIGWLPALVDQARNRKIVPGAPGRIVCSQGVQMLEIPATLDRSRGDIHAAGNPHYMIDPLNAKIVAEHISATLCELVPQSCATFESNLKRFSNEIDVKRIEWQNLLKPYSGRRVVSYHNSWLYFSKRFGIRVDLFLEPKPGIPPSPSHLAEVVSQMRSDKITVIMVDPYINRRTAETAARFTGATLVDVAQFPGGVKGTEGGYIQLLDYLVNSLAKALGER